MSVSCDSILVVKVLCDVSMVSKAKRWWCADMSCESMVVYIICFELERFGALAISQITSIRYKIMIIYDGKFVD